MTTSELPLASDVAQIPTAPLTKYRAALQRYFRKRAPPGEVDDLVQDVFVRLFARRAEDPIQDLERYLFRVATTVLVERHRKAATEMDGHRSAALDLAKLDSLSPERIVIGAESLNRILAALEKLPPRTREAFILHRFDGMTYGAIARRLGVSSSGVEKLMMRALSHLMISLHASD
jgi:RNA polymerase sigma-70 factor (ECF subfamily)